MNTATAAKRENVRTAGIVDRVPKRVKKYNHTNSLMAQQEQFGTNSELA